MKKLFLTSGLILCMAGQASASTPITYGGSPAEYGSSGCNETYLDTYQAPASLEAIWTANHYAVTYAPGSHGTGGVTYQANSNGDVTYGSNYTVLAPSAVSTPVVADTGYEFTGWNDGTANRATGYTYEPYQTAGALTLTAQWSAKGYTVTYNPSSVAVGSVMNGQSVATTTTQTFTYDATTNLNTNPYSATGYTFNGWTTNKNLAAVNGSNPPASYSNGQSITYKYDGNDAVLTAQWSPNISGAIVLDSSVYPSNDHTQTALYQYAEAGEPDYVSVQATTPLYSKYGVGLYTNSAATTAVTTSSLVPVKAGYTFNGFYAADGTTQVIASDGTIQSDALTQVSTAGGTGTTWYAHWTVHMHSITYNCGTKPGSENLTTGTSAPSAQSNIAYGATVSLSATPGTCEYKGWHFAGWKCSHNIATGATYSGSTANYAAALGETAPYVGVYNVSATGSNLTFNTDDDVVCSATWARNQIGLTWSLGSGVSATLEDGTTPWTAGANTGSCLYDDSITLPNVPKRNGYQFSGWTVSSTSPSSGS